MYLEDTEKYREDMLRQKEEHEKWKKKQGDSDLIFNEKDNKEKT
ncbi:hypothetical protein BG20_I1434 [Candidatus Nitrosarchaeum limnium BG20]|jgi:hypothetical protein|uniref:Uncharacterized protein n=1 Tax=Candidatus Nitrosarchaeum limnium BG20 TaxID=859192 RepID=S2EPZ7_9ARCH|nr:hypothetical protein BG20_I1434 [Candidatus Nitrosarchaeum limnium BG20]